jgi:acetolactate synthase-1/2/3 large subunit
LIISDLISKWLEENNLNRIFAVTGGASLFLTDSISKNKNLEICYNHHEQGAAIAAEGWSRVTGRSGIVVLTLGPGATNAITGVVGSLMDSVPMLIFSGQSFRNQTVKNSNQRQNGIQEFNILAIASSFCKQAIQLDPTLDIIQQLNECLELANTGRPGPVWIEVPVDVQKFDLQQNHNESYRKQLNQVITDITNTSEDFELLKKAMKESKRPILLLGNGARKESNITKLSEMAKNAKIPIILSHNSYDFLSFEDENNLGFTGIFGHRYSNIIVQNCDLIISIGNRLSLAQTGYNKNSFGKLAKIFQVDIDPTELKKDNINIFKSIQMDSELFINELVKFSDAWMSIEKEWLNRCNKLKNRFDPIFEQNIESNKEVNSYLFVEKFSTILSNSDHIVTDMGLSYQCTYQQIKLKPGNRLITNTGFAEMGWGVPGAIGVCMGSKRKTYCFTGDGGLMMNIQELSTIKYHNLPIVVIIFNNGGYLTIKQSQELGFSNFTGVDQATGISFPNFEEIARAFGFNFKQIKLNNEIEKSLEYLKNCETPTIIELCMSIDQLQAPKAISIYNEELKFSQSLIENPFPFLGEVELDQIQQNLRGGYETS